MDQSDSKRQRTREPEGPPMESFKCKTFYYYDDEDDDYPILNVALLKEIVNGSVRESDIRQLS